MKKRLPRIIGAAVLFLMALLVPKTPAWCKPLFFLASYLVVGLPVIVKAAKNLLHGGVLEENFLMTIATVGALLLGEYPEAVAVMLFYEIGEAFQSRAVAKSRQSIAWLMDIRPDYANVRRGAALLRCAPQDVAVGEEIVVQPGEKIPLDGTIIAGGGSVDTKALTGESVPRGVTVGDEARSGCVSLSGLLTIKVEKDYDDSTVSKILELIESATDRKAKMENFITRFAMVYTPVVVVAAILLAIVPSLLTRDWSVWVMRALTFLVVSCPCALVVSIPLSFFGGIGGASRNGILVKGSNYLEALAHTETVVFDKTGTLTKGVFRVTEIHPCGMRAEALLELAAYAESYSNHPISLSLKAAYAQDIDKNQVADVEEISGQGVCVTALGKRIYAGSGKGLASLGLDCPAVSAAETVVHVAADSNYAGYILIADEVKQDAAEALASLKKAGVRRTVMLTGDRRAVGEKVARDLGIDEVYAELLPADKVEKVETLLKEAHGEGKLAFVGDGINDAPVLARADVGIAMGELGADAAIEAADIVIMRDELPKIAEGIKIAKRTLRIARQNTYGALGLKGIVLLLSVFGIANMWMAVFADVGVTVIAVLNAFRLLRNPKPKKTAAKPQ